jgi:hypothetical protein
MVAPPIAITNDPLSFLTAGKTVQTEADPTLNAGHVENVGTVDLGAPSAVSSEVEALWGTILQLYDMLMTLHAHAGLAPPAIPFHLHRVFVADDVSDNPPDQTSGDENG